MGPGVEASILARALEELLDRGRRAAATVRPAGAAVGVAGSGPGVPVDDWSSQRSIVYDQAMANRWKADCLRLLREAWGTDAGPYREFGDAVERAGVLWRALPPGLAILERLRSAVVAGVEP
jgi:hypothetical protein